MDVYATGAVNGGTNVGGLAGNNDSVLYPAGPNYSAYVENGQITQGYAIGLVSGTTNVGGLVGNNAADTSGLSPVRPATVSQSYFDTSTTGTTTAIGAVNGTGATATGKTTAQLELMTIANYGWSATNWAIVANTSLPYFKWLYASAPQVVAGIAYSDHGSTVLAGDTANLDVSGWTGASAGTAAAAVGSTGANGGFYFLVPNATFSTGSPKKLLVTTAGASGGATFQENTTASAANLSVYGTYLKDQAAAGSVAYSTVANDLATTFGSLSDVQSRLANLANLEIDPAAGAFTLDTPISTGTLVLSTTGAVTQSAAITATALDLLGTGGSYALLNASNSIGTLAANTASVSLDDAAALTVGVAGGTTGVTTSGLVSLADVGSLTVANAITFAGANALTLSAGSTLAIDATVSVTGAGAVTLNTGLDTTTLSGTSLTELSFGSGGSLGFGTTNNGASLAINGTSYTLLYSASDLANINTNAGVQGDYALADSLDLSGATGWTPLGTNGANAALNAPYGFSGIFEGLGNTISNLAVNTGTNNYSGLFGITSGTIRDLGLSNVTANGAYSVGPLAGLNGGVIANVAVSGTSGATGSNTVGGLVGHNNAGGRIVDASTRGTASGTSRVGGAIGQNDGIVIATTSADTVSGNLYVGGFVGQNDGTIRANSTESGNVTATGASSSGVGGFAGMNYTAGVLSGDSETGNVTGSSSGGTTDIGGFAGINGASLTGDTSSGQVGIDTVSWVVGGLVGRNYGSIDSSSSSSAVEGGNQTGGLIGYNTGSLTNATQTGFVTGTTKAGGAIGENAGTTVSNDTATGAVSGTQYAGGFVGQNDAGATILASTAGTGPVTGTIGYLGGFAGLNAGTISGDHAFGPVGNGTSQVIVGGLVGRNYGTVAQSSAAGAVEGGNMTGGLVGWSSGAVSNSYASGAVIGTAKAGGFIGENDATATNVYATGSVTGTQYVGGLAGDNMGTITHAYASGAVSGTNTVGGLVGLEQTGAALGTDYWDSLATGLTREVGAGIASGVTAIGGAGQPAPFAQATYAGFDFTSIWIVTAGHRPTLIGVE